MGFISDRVAAEVIGIMYGEALDPATQAYLARKDFEEMDRRNKIKTRMNRIESTPRLIKDGNDSDLKNMDRVNKHINEYYYKLINIPDVMSQRSEYELDDSTAGPVKTPFGYEVGEGMFSINWMIQNYAKGVPFEFSRWEDCVDAVKWLGAYIELLEKDLEDYKRECEENQVDPATGPMEKIFTFLHMAKELHAVLAPLSKRLQNYYSNIPTLKEKVKKAEVEMKRKRLGIITDKNKDIKLKPRFTQQLLNQLNRTKG